MTMTMTMTMEAQIRLVKTRKRRIILHAITFIRDHHFRNHAKGIFREIYCKGKAIV